MLLLYDSNVNKATIQAQHSKTKALGGKAKDLGFKDKTENFGIKAKAKTYHHWLER